MHSKNSEAPKAATFEASNLSVSTKELTMKSLAKSTVNCTNSIVISDIKIHMDAEGRYSLNDLHKAADKEHRHLPNYWMDLQQTKELIEEILNTGNPVFKPTTSKKGRYGGTYVCKELVYSYAMWISAAFALKVIRAYDALVTGNANEAVRIAKTTVSERTPLRDAVNMLVGKKGLRYDDAYNMVHQRFGIDSIDELSLDQIPQAVEYVHRIVLDGEFIGKAEVVSRAIPVGNYNFPVETADPHNRKFGNDWITPRVILDEMNRAPELELLEALESDGYDVTGAKIRIHAMYGIVKQHMEMQKDISEMRRYLSTMKDIVEYQTTERGMNVSFTGKDRGGAWGGYIQRRLPN
ncbi:KilA-N domain-containing protein [Enterobacter hormaechei]|uniref:KilA-N domain-containing protein n=1 Tax=Enterobacter hormaechei TaxID=158836 RepID=UPI0020564600|nr:MAG TPA: KilA-N domain [Caudoviricetes sp.]